MRTVVSCLIGVELRKFDPPLWHAPYGVRVDLGGHLKYSQCWSGVHAGVLLGAQGAVHRGESRGGL